MKKIFLIFLIIIITTNPLAVAGQYGGDVGSLDDQLLEKFSRNISDSWKEAMAIWTRIYNFVISIWYQYIEWRVNPIWERISRQTEDWANRQITTIKDAFRKDKEKAGEIIKEGVVETGKDISKSIWQRILETLGIQ